MRTLSRVVWSEGMYLAQHHFQQQARYFEDLVDFGLGVLRAAPYGLLSCALDDDALRNGTVSVLEGVGIMPDGLVFQFPDDPIPDPILVADRFSPTKEQEPVALWVAARQEGSARAAQPGGPEVRRFEPATRKVLDEITGSDEADVETARKRLYLSLGSEIPEGVVSLPIARIRRDGGGGFAYDDSFVPPCLSVGASPTLVALVGRLVGILQEKSRSLAEQHGPARATHRDFADREIASYWFTHAVNTGLATLRHHKEAQSAHPETLYLDLSRLAGALCTFAFEADAGSLPTYDHDRLDEVFSQLDRHIRRHLDVVLPTRRPALRFERTEPHVFTTRITDPRALHPDAVWYLGLSSDASPRSVVEGAPGLLKICAARYMERALAESRPGMELFHEPNPPADIDPRPGSHYFRVATRDGVSKKWWSLIVSVDEKKGVSPEEVGRVGAYVPESFGDVELELAILPPGA